MHVDLEDDDGGMMLCQKYVATSYGSIQKNKVMPKIALSPEQCRAARALLGWSQQVLADRAGIAKQTLADFERHARQPYPRTLADIARVLETAGIEFLPENDAGEGVRFRARRDVRSSPESSA